MSISVFIDGAHGTTGLEIRQRLADRSEINLIELGDDARKDAQARREALHSADFAILCLPDQAARESVELAAGANTRIIDASTVHRTAEGWIYGFSELEPGQRDKIVAADRVTNPGCYALTSISLIRPLVGAGLIAPDAALTLNATSGYSGGGRTMIEEFEQEQAPTAFRNYALSLGHKHLPEIQRWAGLTQAPLFSPSVANVRAGMIVELPLWHSQLEQAVSTDSLRAAFENHYAGSATVGIIEPEQLATMQDVTIERCVNTDRLEILVFANDAETQFRIVGSLDNLGKGAAGSAVQNLNLMAGLPETSGLRL